MRAPAPVFSYETLFLSDLHLGSGKTASSYLYEFLTHLNPDTLKESYLVGDIIGGWEQAHQKQRPFDEMERRCLDVLNYLAARGVKLTYLPGNHDERLRGILDRKGQTVDVMGMLNASAQRDVRRNRVKTFSENIRFKHDDTRVFGSKKWRIVHSDLHDPQIYNVWWFKPVVYFTSEAYDGLIALDSRIRKIAQKYFKTEIAIAKNLKHWFKNTIENAVSREALVQELEHDGCDGAVIGHTHMPGVQRIHRHGRTYTIVNDGDWQEGGSAAFISPGGDEPQVFEYRMERGNYFATPLPDETTPHPAHYAAHREQTNRQIRLIRRMWPVKRKSKLAQLAKYRHAGQKLREHLHDLDVLDTAIEQLRERNRHNIETIKTAIGDTILKKRRFDQRAGEIRDIFARAVKHGRFEDNDRRVLLTVAQDLQTRATQKLDKHFNDRVKAARNLDHTSVPTHPRPHDRQMTLAAAQ